VERETDLCDRRPAAVAEAGMIRAGAVAAVGATFGRVRGLRLVAGLLALGLDVSGPLCTEEYHCNWMACGGLGRPFWCARAILVGTEGTGVLLLMNGAGPADQRVSAPPPLADRSTDGCRLGRR